MILEVVYNQISDGSILMKLPPTLQDRASGILLHPTSLPNTYPIGDLGPAACAFADFLAESGQRWWQMLPLGPAGPGNSPYQSYSAFAGNPALISPDLLLMEGFLKSSDFTPAVIQAGRVDFKEAAAWKGPLLVRAFDAFTQSANKAQQQDFEQFCLDQKAWLDDFALFFALRKTSGESWGRWPKDLRSRNPRALGVARRYLAAEVRYHQFVQWIFALQWKTLRRYCADRGIGLIGDIPIFVALNSADVWAHPEIFKLRPDGSPDVIAGVPPDYFSETGQLWGNPLYRWDVLQAEGYRWWAERFRQSLTYFDVVRLDHFIGFVRDFEIPPDAATAEKGEYHAGPGEAFFREIRKKLGRTPFIAEDLGVMTEAVKKLRDRLKFPGMHVLQFLLEGEGEPDSEGISKFPKRCVVYTGTHDNNTTVGWLESLAAEKRRKVLEALSSDGQEIHWDLIRAGEESDANTMIIPLQDVLGLGPEARMNIPGTPEGNWTWRLSEKQLTPSLAGRLHDLTKASGRTP